MEDNADRFGLGVLATRTNLKALKSFFAKAVMEEWITTNPADKVPLPKAPTWEVSVLSAENGEKLFASCANDPISLRLALEAFGGLRYSSAARLVKTDLRLDEHGITLPADKHKSGRRHYLEGLPENLWSWIKRWWDDPRAWAMTERQILKAKSEAFTKAGVPHPKNVLRHSFCSHHIALHTDAAKTAVLLQHTSSKPRTPESVPYTWSNERFSCMRIPTCSASRKVLPAAGSIARARASEAGMKRIAPAPPERSMALRMNSRRESGAGNESIWSSKSKLVRLSLFGVGLAHATYGGAGSKDTE